MDDKRKTALSCVLCCGVLVLAHFVIPALAQNVNQARVLDGVLKDYTQLGGSSTNMILGATGLPQANDLDFAKIIAYVFFGGIGFVAFMYGKKTAFWRPLVIGIALMGYPYFISTTAMIYIIGAILTAMLYFWRG